MISNSENQNTEWKESWNDNFLEWICGFANAQGGKIYIGKNDDGIIVGVENHRELLDVLPNKIRSVLGITTEINLRQQINLYYVEIVVQPSTVAISLRGRYYYRSGSVKLELTGIALNEFLLKKSGLTWDEVVVEGASFSHIDQNAIDRFKKATLASGRLPDIATLSNEQLFEKLHLLKDGKIKRAGVILFATDPYDFFSSVRVKIGRFGKTGSDIRFHELIEGNLIHLYYETLQILDTKFLVRNISYDKSQRVETLEYPEDALKEIIWNALIHGRFTGVPIQIKVLDDQIIFWNDGPLPDGMTEEQLKGFHKSLPRNPLIADVCFKAGFIESWGRGTLKVAESVEKRGLPAPQFINDSGGFQAVLFKFSSALIGDKSTTIDDKSTTIDDKKQKVLDYLKKNKSAKSADLAKLLGFSPESSSTRVFLKEMVSLGLLITEGAKKNRIYRLNKD